MFLRTLSSAGHFSTILPEGNEASVWKILSTVVRARGQVHYAANFTILVHSMRPAESAAVFFLL